MRPAQLVRRRNVELDRLAAAEETLDRAPPNACGRKSIERTGASRRSSATWSASGSSCSRRGSGMRSTAASTSRSSTTVRDDRFERHVEREALRERARDLVERPEPARGGPLGRECLLELGSETAWPPRAAARSGLRPRDGRRSPRAARARRRPAPCARSDRRRAGRSTSSPTTSGSAVALSIPASASASVTSPRRGSASTCRR